MLIHVKQIFHILHDPTFHAEYTQFRQSPEEVPLAFLALLFVVLSISVGALDSDHPILNDLGLKASASANIKSLAAKYRSAAMRCLSADQFLWRHNLHTVQALVLLIYGLSHAHGPSWALLGTTFNICISIGCHIDPSQIGLNPVRSEQRRRCWAGLKLLYTIQNACLGNLSPMRIPNNVRLPADLDDDEITSNGTPQYQQDDYGQKPPSKMSYILFKFKLYDLASEICQFARDTGQVNGLREFDHRISKEEHEQEARFADGQQLPVYHLAHQYILNNYTHYLRLILHRPYLRPQRSGPDGAMGRVRDQVIESRAYCTTSAMAILNNHENLFCLDEFRPYRWFIYGLGSLQAFLAASTLIVLLASEDDLRSSHRPEFFHVLRKCHSRFEQMAARSDVCSKAATILRRLLHSAPRGTETLEPPPLLHHSSGNSDESEMCSISDGHSTYGHNVPVPGFMQQTLPYDGEATKMDTSFFNCPPQMYDLMALPPEQWLGGASGLAWDWTGWVDVASEPLTTGPESFVAGPNGLMM